MEIYGELAPGSLDCAASNVRSKNPKVVLENVTGETTAPEVDIAKKNGGPETEGDETVKA